MMRCVKYLLSLCMALMMSNASAFSPVPTFQPATGRLSTGLDMVKIKVVVGDGEPIESAIRRFKREVNKSGHLIDLRHKRFFESTQEKRKRKIVQARQRKRFERMQKRRLQNRT